MRRGQEGDSRSRRLFACSFLLSITRKTLIHGKREQRGDAIQHAVDLDRGGLCLLLHDFAHVAAPDIRDPPMPSGRQDFLLQDAADF